MTKSMRLQYYLIQIIVKQINPFFCNIWYFTSSYSKYRDNKSYETRPCASHCDIITNIILAYNVLSERFRFVCLSSCLFVCLTVRLSICSSLIFPRPWGEVQCTITATLRVILFCYCPLFIYLFVYLIFVRT